MNNVQFVIIIITVPLLIIIVFLLTINFSEFSGVLKATLLYMTC